MLARIASIATLLTLAACASQTRVVHERLDEPSGTTVLSGAEPMVFARTEPQYSRSGRDRSADLGRRHVGVDLEALEQRLRNA